jgi:DNA-binding SARP family transcriptional activator
MTNPVVRFGILGPVEARIDHAALHLGGAKQELVLALLLLDANRVVSIEQLIDGVWSSGNDGRNAATLQVYISNLRRLFATTSEKRGSPLIVTRRPGYLIEIAGPAELDAAEFEGLRREGAEALAAGRPSVARQHLREALALWRGEALGGLPFDPAVVTQVAQLSAARLAATETLMEAGLAAGAHRETLDEIGPLVTLHPYNERLRELKMLALYRCGRQVEALDVFTTTRRLLIDELGVEPSPALRQMEDRILRQDPGLDYRTPQHSPFGIETSTVVRLAAGRPAVLEYGDTTIRLDRRVTTIGRRADQHVVITSAEASRAHAEVRASPDGYSLIDNASANGTKLNGQRIDKHTLIDGDNIEIGEDILVFRYRD